MVRVRTSCDTVREAGVRHCTLPESSDWVADGCRSRGWLGAKTLDGATLKEKLCSLLSVAGLSRKAVGEVGWESAPGSWGKRGAMDGGASCRLRRWVSGAAVSWHRVGEVEAEACEGARGLLAPAVVHKSTFASSRCRVSTWDRRLAALRCSSMKRVDASPKALDTYTPKESTRRSLLGWWLPSLKRTAVSTVMRTRRRAACILSRQGRGSFLGAWTAWAGLAALAAGCTTGLCPEAGLGWLACSLMAGASLSAGLVTLTSD
ncbi:hypothetical protein V8C86DRAFT_2872658 [Haematococcus lacustris]